MSNPNKPVKWHQMDEAAARALTEATEDPCGVFPMPPSSVPESLQKIDGIGSYFASGYVTPQIMHQGLSLDGEIVIARTEGATAKAYNFVFAKSSDGNVFFAGPYKDFPQHHFPATSVVPVEERRLGTRPGG